MIFLNLFPTDLTVTGEVVVGHHTDVTATILPLLGREELATALFTLPDLIPPCIRTSGLMGYNPIDPEHVAGVTRLPSLQSF